MKTPKQNGPTVCSSQPVKSLSKFASNSIAIQIIERALSGPATISAFRRNRAALPYYFKAITSDEVLPLNRDYRPIGCTVPAYEFIDYESPILAPLRLPRAAINWEAVSEKGYFFHDGNSPLTGPPSDRREYISRVHSAFAGLGLQSPEVTP